MKIDSVPAVVTGGASGLGRACVEMLCAMGARVTIADIDEEAGRRVARETDAEFVRTDVRNVADVEALFDHTGASDPVRILVTCAGVAPKLSLTGEDGPFCMDAFRYVLETNLTGTILPISRFVDRLKDVEPCDEEAGVIITTSSIAAFDGQSGHTAYSASKAGVAGMTLPLAREFGSKAIRVACIAPGPFDTPMIGDLPPRREVELGTQSPYPGRLGKPEEFASLVRQIIENPMLNGGVIRLDGALRMLAH